MQQFLAQGDVLRPYRATRHLEAAFGSERGWMDVVTEYSLPADFRYQITANRGSDWVQEKVLRAVLNGERDLIAQGMIGRALLTPENYVFRANGIDDHGLAEIRLAPRRNERLLIAGVMLLNSANGDLVRIQGRLAKSPSFPIKSVYVVRAYERIGGAVVPVSLEAKTTTWLLGSVAPEDDLQGPGSGRVVDPSVAFSELTKNEHRRFSAERWEREA